MTGWFSYQRPLMLTRDRVTGRRYLIDFAHSQLTRVLARHTNLRAYQSTLRAAGISIPISLSLGGYNRVAGRHRRHGLEHTVASDERMEQCSRHVKQD